MIYDNSNEVLKELFRILLSKHQTGLEKTSTRGSAFVFDCVHLLHYKCHKINPSYGGSYIDSPDWIKNKKATINSINKKYDKYFQYTVTVALNQEKIGGHPERITKIKPFTYKYNWEGINFPSKKDDWKKFDKNNLAITLNVWYAKNEKNIPCLHFKT